MIIVVIWSNYAYNAKRVQSQEYHSEYAFGSPLLMTDCPSNSPLEGGQERTSSDLLWEEVALFSQGFAVLSVLPTLIQTLLFVTKDLYSVSEIFKRIEKL